MIRLNTKKIKSLFYFGCAGVVGYVVDLLVTLLFSPSIGKYAARIPAFILSSTSTWIFNRNITFKHSYSDKSLIREWLHYESLMIFGLIINYIAYAIAVSLLPNSLLSTAISVAIGSLAGMVVNFISSSKFLFNKKIHNK